MVNELTLSQNAMQHEDDCVVTLRREIQKRLTVVRSRVTESLA